MRQLSLTDTQNLVSKLTKSLGERGAARALNKMGYRSPENCEIKQGHVCRVQAGSWTCFLAPEEPPEAVEIGAGKITSTNPIEVEIGAGKIASTNPIAPRPPIPEKTPARYLERGPVSADASPEKRISVEEAGDQDPREVRQRLKNELIAEEEARQERELNLPPEVPRTSDYSRSEHSNLERSARVSGIFNRRAPVEFDETKEDFFGLPRLQRQPPKTTSRPYEPRSFATLPMSPTEPYTLQSKKG